MATPPKPPVSTPPAPLADAAAEADRALEHMRVQSKKIHDSGHARRRRRHVTPGQPGARDSSPSLP